ncbi:hypothetical protein MY4824_000536 [Beauveria thailandica]
MTGLLVKHLSTPSIPSIVRSSKPARRLPQQPHGACIRTAAVAAVAASITTTPCPSIETRRSPLARCKSAPRRLQFQHLPAQLRLKMPFLRRISRVGPISSERRSSLAAQHL